MNAMDQGLSSALETNNLCTAHINTADSSMQSMGYSQTLINSVWAVLSPAKEYADHSAARRPPTWARAQVSPSLIPLSNINYKLQTTVV